MELHRDLRELVERSGAEILESASDFRGMLEDLIGDDPVPSSSVNLLVEAVRYQAPAQLVRMIDNGADPAAAVRTAGARFAEERGGGDPELCSWACAVLGFAVGRVDEETVAWFTSLQTRRIPAAPQEPVAQEPTPARADSETVQVSPLDDTGGALLPQPPPSAAAPAPRRWVPAAVGVTLLLVVLVVAAVVWVRSANDDGVLESDSSPVGGEGSANTGGETDNADDLQSGDADLDLTAVADRYADLAGSLAAIMAECEPLDSPEAVEELLSCPFAHGTLELTTYATVAQLEAARSRLIDTRQGNLSDVRRHEAFYAFDPSISESSDPAEIYWDSAASAQSALMVAAADYPYNDLLTDFEQTSPTVDIPTRPGNPHLIHFIDDFGITDCERSNTYGLGQSEESECSLGGHTTFVAKFGTRRDLLRYREYTSEEQRADTAYSGPTEVCRQFDTNPACGSAAREEVVGQIRGYVANDGTGDESGVLYLDDPQCGCYLEVWGFEGEGGGDPDALLSVLYPDSG